MEAFLVILVIIAVVGVIIFVVYWLEKKRTEELRQVAVELEFDFYPKGDALLMRELGGFHLTSQGHSKRLYNLMRGQANKLEVDIFDYSYTVGAGKHQQTFQQTVVCF